MKYRIGTSLALLALPLLACLALGAGLAAAAPVAAPAVDLNGAAPGVEYATTFTEDEVKEPIVSVTGLTVVDADSETLTQARATLTNRPDGAKESLTADAGASGLTVKYAPDTGELTIKGSATLTTYQDVLRTLSYSNTSQSPNITDRVVLVVVNDGDGPSAPVTSTVAIYAVNDAPVLDNTGTMTLASINEDDTTSNGNSVEKIIQSAELNGEDRITDVDDGALEGIAVIEVGGSNGSWQYSLTGGASWSSFGAVSNSAAVLLNKAARIRFVPNPNFSGQASFTFRAWDQTSGVNGATGVDVSLNGGTTAFSVDTETATITVSAVNDLPVVDLNGPDPGADFAATFYESGLPVAIADVDATIADADNTQLASATFTLTDRPDGAQEILAANTAGTSITAAPYDPATGALVLNGPDSVANFQQVLRQVTYANSSGNPTPTSRPIQVVVSDGTGSSAVVTSTIKVNTVNNAPVLDPTGPFTLSTITEDALQPAGNKVADIIASAGGDAITDPDTGAVEGIAVVGLDSSKGVWQYSLANPPVGPESWLPAAPVSPTAALLLSSDAWLRFVPAPNAFGPSGPLQFRAWDQSAGANGQRGADTTVNGGTTPFSAETAAASLLVTPVNDPPRLSGLPAQPPTYVEDDPGVAALGAQFTVTDVDSALLASATVQLVNPLDGDAEWLLVDTAGTGVSATYEDGTLQLTGQASPAVYTQLMRQIAYRNTSQDPDPTDRLLKVSVSDGAAASPVADTAVQVQAVNDPPELDLDGSGAGEDYKAVFYINWGPVPIVDKNLSVTDADHTMLKSASVQIVNPVNKQAELLAADLTGTMNIKQSYNSTTGVLSLTGVDTVANYQKVLRTLTYDNALPQPDTTPRTVTFTVSDGVTPSVPRQTVVTLLPPPTVQFFLPSITMIPEVYPVEEPNDACPDAYAMGTNRTFTFFPDDKNDWFTFELTADATLSVELRDFLPGAGQVIVAYGPGCGNLQLIGSNGDSQPNKVVALGRRSAGRYFIWVINDGLANDKVPYRLHVRAVP